MMIALEGIAGSGKSTLRDRILELTTAQGIRIRHVGQFSWLSLHATRTLVDLRTGRAPVTEAESADAMVEDLTQHAQHNLTPAVDDHMLADRWVLSTSALLELTHPGATERHMPRLARIESARPDLTVLLSTPVEICARRLALRPTPARLGDGVAAATELRGIYDHCADIWQQTTGLPVIRRSLETIEHTEELARELLTDLRKADR